MFQRAFRLLILVSLALVVSPAIAPLQAQPEAVPYIYYFSNTLKAFVIERADGTDTRILGDGLLAPDASEYANAYSEGYYLIDGPGWSPSGRWLAWGADLFTGYYDHGSGSKPYVIRSDGAQRVTMLDNLDDAEMAWAPHADLLLVASQLDPFSGANKNTFIGLIDPTRNVPIAAFSLPFSHAMNCGIGDVRWTADGHGIAQYTVTDVPAIYDFEARQGFFIVDTKGAAVQKVFDRIITDEPFGEGCTAALSAVGDIAYQVQHALVVENLITGVRHIIPDVFSTDKEFEGAHLHWNSDGRYGLLFGGRGAASGNPADLKLLMRDTNRVVSLLPNGLMEESDPGQSWPLWSPDGNHALLLNGDKLYHVDADSGTISPLLEDVSSSTIGFMWTGSSQVMVARGVVNEGQAQKSAMDAYDFTTGKHTTLSDIPEEHVAAYGGPHYHFDLSPDGNFMAYVEHGLVIHDLRTGADRRIRPSPRGTQYDGGGEASWSKDGRWLFIYESSGMTTPYPRDVSIVRADGEMRRTLTYTDFTPTPVLLDWLPEQVKLETLPPALKRPSYPSPQKALHGDDWHEQLSWSPDSRHISALNQTTPPTLWNVESGTSSVPFPTTKTGINDSLDWQKQADGTYSPILSQMTPPITPFTPFATRILARSADGNLEVRGNLGLYDKHTGKFIRTVGTEDDQAAEPSAAFSPDGKLLAIGGNYAKVQIWDAQTWQSLLTLPDPSIAIAFSPDGKWLATGSSWDVHLWDVTALLGY